MKKLTKFLCYNNSKGFKLVKYSNILFENIDNLTNIDQNF